MKHTSVEDATHVKVHGRIEEIVSKFGVGPGRRLAKPSEGGFGVVTKTGKRVSMWDAQAYFKDDSHNEK
jgi:hypothetical protein